MELHRNAKLGLGWSVRVGAGESRRVVVREAAAAAFSVSPATAVAGGTAGRRRLRRQRRSLFVCSIARAGRTAAAAACRRSQPSGSVPAAGDRLGAAAGRRCDRLPHSTVWKVLRRAGISRTAARAREPANRYEWPCPGDLLHMDSQPLRPLRAARPRSHRRPLATSRDWIRPGEGRLRLRARDRRRPLTARLRRAPRRRTRRDRHRLRRARHSLTSPSHGIARQAADDRQRLDATPSNRSLRELLARRGIRHLTTEPYRPRTNGKVERFHQTMAREWAYGLRYRSDRHRAASPATLAQPLQRPHGHTAHSAADPQSAAFTTSSGRTASRRPGEG